MGLLTKKEQSFLHPACITGIKYLCPYDTWQQILYRKNESLLLKYKQVFEK